MCTNGERSFSSDILTLRAIDRNFETTKINLANAVSLAIVGNESLPDCECRYFQYFNL